MLYSVAAGSPFWRYACKFTKGDYVRQAAHHYQVNYQTLKILPDELWLHIFEYIFNYYTPARIWQFFCLTCQKWNAMAKEWKRKHPTAVIKYRGGPDRRWQDIPEERLLRAAQYSVYFEVNGSPLDDSITDILPYLKKWRGAILRDSVRDAKGNELSLKDHPPPYHIPELYREWWARWGIGVRLPYSVASEVWAHKFPRTSDQSRYAPYGLTGFSGPKHPI